MGIPEVGRKTAKILAEYVAKKFIELEEAASTRSLYSILSSLEEQKLTELRDIGPVGAESIVDYIEDQQEVLARLLQEVQPTLPRPPR